MTSADTKIKSVIRPMRGGSQAYLVQTQDGRHFVAKFAGNPQGTRTLINEWIAQHVFERLGVSTPRVEALQLTQDTARDKGLLFHIGNRHITIEPGVHLGSQCPADPSKEAIFDFLPKKLLPNIVNLADFAKAFVIDKFLCNTDRRQAIFIRTKPKGKTASFQAYMVDHGMAFNGSIWELRDAPLDGLSMDRDIYLLLDMQSICTDTVKVIEQMSESELLSAIQEVPSAWFLEPDRDAFAKLSLQLRKRRIGLRGLVERHLRVLQEELVQRSLRTAQKLSSTAEPELPGYPPKIENSLLTG